VTNWWNDYEGNAETRVSTEKLFSLINPLYVGGHYVRHMILRLYRTTLLTGAAYWFCFSEQRNIILCTFNLIIFVTYQRRVFGSKASSFGAM
jgi:hypothetical protein